MTSRFSARISVDAGDRNAAIFDSVEADGRFQPGNQAETEMRLADSVEIEVRSDRLPHLRAGLNSTLRLIQACDDALDACPGGKAGRPRGRGA